MQKVGGTQNGQGTQKLFLSMTNNRGWNSPTARPGNQHGTSYALEIPGGTIQHSPQRIQPCNVLVGVRGGLEICPTKMQQFLHTQELRSAAAQVPKWPRRRFPKRCVGCCCFPGITLPHLAAACFSWGTRRELPVGKEGCALLDDIFPLCCFWTKNLPRGGCVGCFLCEGKLFVLVGKWCWWVRSGRDD